jgi:hypothetical protein
MTAGCRVSHKHAEHIFRVQLKISHKIKHTDSYKLWYYGGSGGL